MTSNSPVRDRSLEREILVVIVLTALGALVRLWSVGRLGLVHFDEGIYALAGLWVFSPGGLAGIDPASISYAPPGFPLLIGLSYMFLGVGDVAAILVSIASGTLTIPVVAWLSRRTFGPGAGAAAAGLAAFSGPLVAFSRMALTDASFLLFWLCAMGQGQRFVERPNLFRAVLLGLAVGISQLFKYNGWTSGIIVALSSAVWLFANRRESADRRAAATWGWGLVAVIVAAAVYWPWFAFVDSHGGYRALLAHQRSYVGGLSSWPWHFSHQLAQADGSAWRPGLACVRRPGSRLGHLDQHRGFRRRLSTSRDSAGSSARSHGFVRDHRALVVGRACVGRLRAVAEKRPRRTSRRAWFAWAGRPCRL